MLSDNPEESGLRYENHDNDYTLCVTQLDVDDVNNNGVVEEVLPLSTKTACIGNTQTSVGVTFARNSVAYTSNGIQVAAGVPRYETGKFGQAIMVEEGTTNNIATPMTFAGWRNERSAGIILDNDGSFYPSQAKFARVKTTDWWFESNSIPAANGQTWSVSYIARRGTGDGEPRAAIMIMNASDEHVSNIDPTFSSRNIGGGWVRYEATFTINYANTGYIRLRFYVTATNSGYHDFALPQLEQKPYATSFVDGTRAAETLTIPTAGVLNPQEGTVELTYVPSHGTNVRPHRFILSAGIDTNEFRLEYRTNDRWYLKVGNVNGEYITSLSAGVPVALAVRWDSSTVSLFVNGSKVIQINAAFANLQLGDVLAIGSSVANWGWDYQCNGLIDDLRISSIARSDAEILAAYQSGQPAPVDANTILKADLMVIWMRKVV